MMPWTEVLPMTLIRLSSISLGNLALIREARYRVRFRFRVCRRGPSGKVASALGMRPPLGVPAEFEELADETLGRSEAGGIEVVDGKDRTARRDPPFGRRLLVFDRQVGRRR